MDYVEILKKFIEDKVELAREDTTDRTVILNLRGQAYGALMYAQKAQLIPYDILYEIWEGKDGYYNQFHDILRGV